MSTPAHHVLQLPEPAAWPGHPGIARRLLEQVEPAMTEAGLTACTTRRGRAAGGTAVHTVAAHLPESGTRRERDGTEHTGELADAGARVVVTLTVTTGQRLHDRDAVRVQLQAAAATGRRAPGTQALLVHPDELDHVAGWARRAAGALVSQHVAAGR